jgi:hypothetical protein
MREIKYGFICEDDAHEIFLRSFLDQLPVYLKTNTKFSKSTAHEVRFKYSNFKIKRVVSQVMYHYPEAALTAIGINEVNIFFVGIDYDEERDVDAFEEEAAKLVEELKDIGPSNRKTEAALKDYQERVIFMFPVKSVEHWLWYLKEHPKGKLEAKGNHEAKKAILGEDKDKRGRNAGKAVSELCQNMDIAYLFKASKSFAHFYNQLDKYIKRVSVKE